MDIVGPKNPEAHEQLNAAQIQAALSHQLLEHGQPGGDFGQFMQKEVELDGQPWTLSNQFDRLNKVAGPPPFRAALENGRSFLALVSNDPDHSRSIIFFNPAQTMSLGGPDGDIANMHFLNPAREKLEDPATPLDDTVIIEITPEEGPTFRQPEGLPFLTSLAKSRPDDIILT